MPISIGTWTVGQFGSGADYDTWQLALADLDLGGLTGDLYFQQIAPTFEFDTAKPPSGFLWNGWRLILQTDGYRHLGLGSNDSRIIELGHGNRGFDFSDIDIGTDPGIVMEHLYIRRTSIGIAPDIYLDSDAGSWGFAERSFRYLFLDGNDGLFGQRGINIVGSGGSFDLKYIVGRSYQFSVIAAVMNSSARIENVTTINGPGGLALGGSTGGTVTDCLCLQGGGQDFTGIGSVDGNGNASSDATADDANWNIGSSNIPSVTEDLKSTDKLNEGYLVPNFTSELVGGGVGGSIFAPDRDMMGQESPRVKNFTAPVSSQNIYTIGAQQLSVIATDRVESEDDLPLVKGTIRVSAVDSLLVSEDDVSELSFVLQAEDAFSVVDQDDTLSVFVLRGEDTVDMFDAGITIPDLVLDCTPTILRGQCDFWYPVDTMANHLGLPQPLPDDTYNLDTRVRTRHAKGGDLRVYKRGKVLHSLQMNFRVETSLRNLALVFYELSSSQEVRFLDWENRLWHGVVTNTPIAFNAVGKSSNTEAFTFTIEFEGTRR